MKRSFLTTFVALCFGAGVASADIPLLVSGIESNAVHQYGPTGNPLGIFGDASFGGSGLQGPRGVMFGLDGNLYVSSFDTDSVMRYDGQTGAFIDAFIPSGSGGLNGPRSLAFGPDNNLYVASGSGDAVLRYNGFTGAFLGVFGDASFGGSGLQGPRGLIFDGDGNLLVANRREDNVLKYDSAGTFLGVFTQSGSVLDGPSDLAFGPNGTLIVNSPRTDEVLEFNGTTGEFIGVFGEGNNADSGLVSPLGLLFGGDGYLYVASAGTDEVLRYDAFTGDFVGAYVTAGSGGIDGPGWMVVPEPTTLVVLGLASLTLLRRKRRLA